MKQAKDTEKIPQIFEDLVLLCRKIEKKIQKEKTHNYIEISNSLDLVIQTSIFVKVNLVKLVETSIQRTRLIDLQIYEGIFEGPLHDGYHAKLDEIETELNNLYLSIKTLTNRIPDLFASFLNHSIRRTIKTGSFGRFVNSLSCFKTSNTQLTKAVKKVYTICDEIDKIHNSYRDKFIEHTKPSSLRSSIRSVGPSSVVRIHYKEAKTIAKERVKTIGGKPHWTKFSVQSEYYYYVHISLSDKIDDGYLMRKGEVMGEIYDSDTNHFKKYPAHVHIFSSPNIRNLPPPFSIVETEYSPEPLYITSRIIESLTEIIKTAENIYSSDIKNEK